MLNISVSILKYLIVYALGHITGKYLFMLLLIRKHAKEKHICNYCEVGFLSSNEELKYEYCPYCGKPLDYHQKDERSKSFKGERKW